MMLDNIGLFKGIVAKMNWLDQNQQVLAQNVANSDTPGYRPQALKTEDFSSYMNGMGQKDSVTPLKMAATDASHLGAGGAAPATTVPETPQKKIYEASPDGNGVVLEEQLFKANRNSMDYQLMTDVYRRSAGMIRMALQGSGR